MIEQVAGCSITEIHSLYGTSAYRRYERRALEETVQLYPEMVLATPGGLVSDASTFNLLLSHTIAGFFADPIYSGNRDMVGWKLIGFPGAQITYANDILNFGAPFTGPFTSLAAYQGQFDGG